jgi:hypothetical protein
MDEIARAPKGDPKPAPRVLATLKEVFQRECVKDGCLRKRTAV